MDTLSGFLFPNFELDRLNDKFLNCWVFHEIEVVEDGNKGIKFSTPKEISKEHYDSRRLFDENKNYIINPIHAKNFDYNRLNSLIGEKKFKNILRAHIKNLEENFSKQFWSEFEEKITDTKTRIFLVDTLDKMINSIKNLSLLDLNYYQEIVAEHFVSSYLRVIENILFELKGKYVLLEIVNDKIKILSKLNSIYVIRFTDNLELSKYVYPDHILKFEEYEKKLRNNKANSFFDDNGNWVSTNNNLIRFFKFLDNKSFFKNQGNKTQRKLLIWFEKRYNVDLGKYKEPSRVDSVKEDRNFFVFLDS
ncbi:hypothetical protein ACSTS3_01300 [Aquimarina muelleri]|uniref:hypothetical protein n=1 Tax=Aquimarina muelleri TaxID=279356 RepID=UPI003F6858B0